ncbi:hypothetical protein IU450_32970 [Nocardia abscessus]|uniref:hypothetical protein n=1 Tax=Nocardia abscessus TaxID=120957 RepID=UPI0018963057|nr:hypothetical protein [Nocardia abscessus]MBF6340672.1 hypothetical protein [Nocardia abscessus]
MSDAFYDALARHQGTSQVQRLLRSSLLAAEAHYNPRPQSKLIVEVGGSRLSPHDSAAIMTGIVDATAMFSRYRLNPRNPVTQLRADYRNAINLTSLGSVGNSLIFGIPRGVAEHDEPDLFGDTGLQSLTGYAVKDMCQILPQDPDDNLALDAVLSLPVTQRVAVQQLVKAVTGTKRSLDVSMITDDGQAEELLRSVLLRDQAELLQSSLLESVAETYRMPPLFGLLDGMRTHRRIFYLEREGEPDIHGSVAEDILSLLPPLIGKLVVVDLERSVLRQKSGRSGRASYRLLGIREAEGVF